MSTVLVTGGTGFLGGRLVPALVAIGHQVVVASRRPFASASPAVTPVQLDLRVRTAFDALPRDVEVIVHAAAVRPEDMQEWSGFRAAVHDSLIGTLNVLEYAKACQARHLIYCSSLAVYALPQPLPIQEDGRTYPIGRPDSSYAIAKLLEELLCQQSHTVGGAACLCLRFGRLYGPGDREATLLSLWAGLAESGQELVVYGDGERSLDFLYVDDAVEAICAAITREPATGILNVSGGVEITWRALAEAIVAVFSPPGRQAAIRLVSEGHRARCVLDVTRVQRLLGWAPRVSLLEGLKTWKTLRDGDGRNVAVMAREG